MTGFYMKCNTGLKSIKLTALLLIFCHLFLGISFVWVTKARPTMQNNLKVIAKQLKHEKNYNSLNFISKFIVYLVSVSDALNKYSLINIH